MSDGERGYLAGLIDGEGTITMHWNKARKRTPAGICSKIFIINTDSRMVKKVSEITGLEHAYKVKERKPPRRPVYSWEVTAIIDIKELLEQIYSYLVVKKEHATLTLRFIEHHLDKKLGIGITKEEFNIFIKIKELNARSQKGKRSYRSKFLAEKSGR